MISSRLSAAEVGRLLSGWADMSSPLPQALAASLREAIDSGLVAPGVTLPSQRSLSGALRVSRSTVVSALSLLEADGYVVSTRGSGTRVRSGRGRTLHHGQSRMFSFTAAPQDVLDLSTGALPASQRTRDLLVAPLPDLAPYMETDGYFPAGLPALRTAIAERLTADGMPTRPQEILVTAGAQQATDLVIRALTSPGDLVVVEEPTYRGTLDVLRDLGTVVRPVPLRREGLDLALVEHALRAAPRLLYCQTSVHNPTGTASEHRVREELAATLARTGTLVVEDCCSYDLTVSGRPASTLVDTVDPSLLVSVGTLSKMFWGGLRVGWIRAEESQIRALTHMRRTTGLGTSVPDQLFAMRCLAQMDAAKRDRIVELRSQLAATEELVAATCPEWSWRTPAGGPGLWVDTGRDTVALAEAARQHGVRLAPGALFSAHDGQRTRLRLPIWHEPGQLEHALTIIRRL